jgi:hypothetical protein
MTAECIYKPVCMYIVYVQDSKYNTDVFAPVVIHILSYDTVKSSARLVFPHTLLLADPFRLQKIITHPPILAHVNVVSG